MTTQTTNDPASYLTFRLGDEMFGVRVAIVREVLELPHIAWVPASRVYMRGVADVRGIAIAVMDLRLRFGLPAPEDTPLSRIIVLVPEIDEEEAVVGAIADSVHEVISLSPSEISVAPKVGMKWKADIIEGIGRQNGRYIILLDMPRILASDDDALLSPDGASSSLHPFPYNRAHTTRREHSI